MLPNLTLQDLIANIKKSLDQKNKKVGIYMYSMKSIENDKEITLLFNINNKKSVSKFKIEELDMLTSSYLSEAVFLQELLKYGGNNISKQGYLVITFNSTYNKKEIPIIYNDKLIYNKAKETRQKKQYSKKDSILLENDLLLTSFISFIKRLAKDKNSRAYILEQDSLFDIPYSVRKSLKGLVKDDVQRFISNDNGQYKVELVEKGIRSLLKEYIVISDEIDHKLNCNESTLELENDKIILEIEINHYFRKDYRNLREMIAFENKYLEVLNYQLQNNKDLESEFIISSLIEEVKLQKLVRNGYLNNEDLVNFYDTMYIPIPIKPKSFIKSDVMRDLFNYGGIPAIMENLSADDIYGKYLEDSKKLGIVKEKYKRL